MSVVPTTPPSGDSSERIPLYDQCTMRYPQVNGHRIFFVIRQLTGRRTYFLLDLVRYVLTNGQKTGQ